MKRITITVPRDARPHGSVEAEDHGESFAGSGSLGVIRASGRYDTFDLEQYQETIRRLFIHENRPLGEVMEIMKTKYNVTASYVRYCLLEDDRHRLTC